MYCFQIVFACDTEPPSTFEKEVELIHDCACTSCFPDNQQRHQQKSLFDNYIYEYDANDVDAGYDDFDVANERMMQRVVHDGARADDAVTPTRAHADRAYIELSADEQALNDAARRRVVAEQERHNANGDVITALLAEQREPHHANNAHAQRYNSHDPQSRHHAHRVHHDAVGG